MGHIFYFTGLLVLLTNIQFLYEFFSYIKIKEWFEKSKKFTNTFHSTNRFKKVDILNYKKFQGVRTLNYLWSIFGILTPTWKVFLIIILFNFLSELLIKYIGEFKLISKIIFVLKSTVVCNLFLITIINHFHLHLDLFDLLLLSCF